MSSQAMSGGPMDWLLEARCRLIGAARRLLGVRAGYDDALARAEGFVQTGRPEQAVPLLLPMRRDAERMRGPCSASCRARWHLAWGYCRGCASELDEAWLSFQAARREADDVGDPRLSQDLRLRAHVELASVALATGKALDTAVQHADEAVRVAGDVGDAYALTRLAGCLTGIARAEHAAGRWPAARGHYEDALNAGLSVPPPVLIAADAGTSRLCVWAEARAAAANAAKEVARTLFTLGDADGCREWFDRGLAALEGPGHPQTHLTRGLLSLERARCESGDDVGAPTRRISWLQEAVREGLACAGPNGRILACRAELDLSAQLRELGDCVGAADHARRVEAHRRDLLPDIAAACDAEAKLALGVALLDAGDEPGALAALREAVERGRHAVLPDARHYAAAAAWHLHAALLGDRRIAEAGLALHALEELVPGLAAEHRPLFVALMAYMRGMTRLCEERHDEARAELGCAETAARRLEKADPDLVRSAAAGLGHVALACEEWQEAEDHFRRALAALPDDAPSARRQAVRADLLLGMARAVAPTARTGEALALIREAFGMGMSSGCSMGRKVAAHAALIEGEAPTLEAGERRRLYETAARLGRVSGLAQGRAIAAEAETRLGELTA
jgi:tetratricopeptide (TPR) repeat protein